MALNSADLEGNATLLKDRDRSSKSSVFEPEEGEAVTLCLNLSGMSHPPLPPSCARQTTLDGIFEDSEKLVMHGMSGSAQRQN
jgi:hypothetical protein